MRVLRKFFRFRGNQLVGREGLTIFVDVFPHVTSILSSFLISKYERASPMVVKPWAMCLVYGRCMAV